jgi:CHAT domain-containing protein
VVLSACETGIGEVRNGEGVYGLRRALLLAGAESQVMTLWRVSDDDTRRFMSDYYRRLQAGVGRGAALQQTQWALLKDRQVAHPYFWAAFIQSGEWRSLAGRTAQPKAARQRP